MSHLGRMVNNQYKGKITSSGEEEENIPKKYSEILIDFFHRDGSLRGKYNEYTGKLYYI